MPYLENWTNILILKFFFIVIGTFGISILYGFPYKEEWKVGFLLRPRKWGRFYFLPLSLGLPTDLIISSISYSFLTVPTAILSIANSFVRKIEPFPFCFACYLEIRLGEYFSARLKHSRIASVMPKGLARPCQAMSKAVPWSTEVRTKGRPRVTDTVR